MKKILILLLCVVTFQSFSSVSAQNRMRLVILNGDCSFLVFVALGKCGIFGNNSWQDPIGAQVGIEAKILEFNENYSLNAGLGVSFQGAAWEDYEMSGKVNLSYLNVPVIFNYESNNGFYGEIGLQPGILLSAKDKYDGDSYDYKEYVKNFELGLPIGAGYRINDQLAVGVRATIGLTNLDNAESEKSDHNYLIVGMVRYYIGWPLNK